MSQQELLKRVIKALEGIEIEYMITGSIVSSLQGEPRSTHDIDIVVAIQKSVVKKLIEAFPPSEFYLDENGIVNAIDQKGMFNLIALKEGGKVDFWVLRDDPFDRSCFARKCVEDVLDIHMYVSSPEDTILSKLRWAKLSGGSEKLLTDALRVYEVQFEKLDMSYLDHWAKRLSVKTILKKLKDKAEII
ncbi:MAG: hypothetical protein M1371_08095 [Actinobacteria bacterium]|nr:hypothetical protein [Actinomycetota bacterium]